MKHIKIEVIPDCPKCKHEMMLIKWYAGQPTDDSPFGTEPKWQWQCSCGFKGDVLDDYPAYSYEAVEEVTNE